MVTFLNAVYGYTICMEWGEYESSDIHLIPLSKRNYCGMFTLLRNNKLSSKTIAIGDAYRTIILLMQLILDVI
jgi:hypothetical protein